MPAIDPARAKPTDATLTGLPPASVLAQPQPSTGLAPMSAPPPMAPLPALSLGPALDPGLSPVGALPTLAALPTVAAPATLSLEVAGASALSQDHGPTPYVSQAVFTHTPRVEPPSILEPTPSAPRAPRTAQDIAHDTPFAFRREGRTPPPPRSTGRPPTPAPAPAPSAPPPSTPPPPPRAPTQTTVRPTAATPASAGNVRPPPTPPRPPPPPTPAPKPPPPPTARPGTPARWPDGLVLEPEARRPFPGTEPVGPSPRPPEPRPTPHPARFPPAGGDSKGGAGKGVLFLMALAIAAIKCSESCTRERMTSPSSPSPTSFPQRNTQPLTAAERRRLEQLRRDHLNGERMTIAERNELLELERRARLSNPGGR